MTGVRAELFDHGAAEFVAIEAWRAERAAGMAVKTPGLRP